MCGAALELVPSSAEEGPSFDGTPLELNSDLDVLDSEIELPPPVVDSVMRERQSSIISWLTAMFMVVIIVLGALVLRYQSPIVTYMMAPSSTPFPPTPTTTPTWTPLPTVPLLPTETATAAPPAQPTETPQPPQLHRVNSGETLIGLALRYRVSVESIADLNNFPAETAIQIDQELQIPWPTATPPLVPVAVTVNGVVVIADPEDCQRHEVAGGDSISGIASRHEVDMELLMLVNRLTESSILHQGDSLCIPNIIFGGSLPPTPGPSPTPSPTSLPAAPSLLYPIRNAVIDPPDGLVTLQWTAVKNLEESEWYMVELTDLDELDSLPRRGFTRDTSLQLPSSWRPAIAESHQLRWRVSIVRVIRYRSDGLPIYNYGGESSEESLFTWFGAVPTPTPRPTETPTPQP